MSEIKVYAIVGSSSFIYGDTFIKVRYILSRGIPTSVVEVRNLLSNENMIFESMAFRVLMLKLKNYNQQRNTDDDDSNKKSKSEKEEYEKDEIDGAISLGLTKIMYGDELYKVKYHWDSISLDRYAIQGLYKAEKLIAEYHHDMSTPY